MRRICTVHNERGVALVLALVVTLVLALIVLGVAQIITSELDIHRVSRWDNILRYVAIAGVEHQIYALKANAGGSNVGYVNYPVLSGETAGCGAFWYNVSQTCILNCTGTPSSRQWIVMSDGEIWNPSRCLASATRLQQRSVRATVTITYAGTTPTGVTFQRWEEVYP